MEFNDFIEKYTDIILDIRMRDRAEIEAFKKYVDIIGNLNIETSDANVLKELLDKYSDIIDSENKAVDDFVNSIKIISSISKRKDEIHDKFKDFVEKIQEKSLEQIESQHVNK